jgi:hypothetical protein
MTLLSLSTKECSLIHSSRQDLSLPNGIDVDINAAWHVAKKEIGFPLTFGSF